MIIRIPFQDLNIKVGDTVETSNGVIYTVIIISHGYYNDNTHLVNTEHGFVRWDDGTKFESTNDEDSITFIFYNLFANDYTIIRKL